MFSAAADSPSLVEMAMSTGRPFLKWLFAAMVTGVSAIPCASFANVLPVQGAMTKTSNNLFGPMGSTSVSCVKGALPQICATRFR